MVEEHEDLRLSLSLNSFQHYPPSKQTLSNIQCKNIIHRIDMENAEDLSPVSTLSNVNGKRIERDDDLEVEDQDGPNSPKKLRLSKQQTLVLEQSFKDQKTLNPRQKAALAKQLNLRPRQVEVWFQNRRARTKLKQTEVECEYLKNWCQKLAEENKRLQKEVGELRALKSVAVSRNMQHMNLATLVTCNSCESSIAKSSTHINPWASYIHREAS